MNQLKKEISQIGRIGKMSIKKLHISDMWEGKLRWKFLEKPVFALAVIALLYGCIEPFSPPEVNSPENYLVVDGFLNMGSDTSVIELRRTQNINQMENPIVEIGAQIKVESENGEEYAFTETSFGKYVLPPYPLDQSVKYRLHIQTPGGLEYLSEYVTVSKTPPIDDVTYKVDPGQDAMVFYINTHDPQNQTQFYRWKFEETWAYRVAHFSALKVVDEKVTIREENINLCWNKLQSRNIILGSTVKLSSDIIKDLPINTVAISTNKLYIKYSILVKQYGLSREAFEYWTTLSKTTQSTGSLFDPQPSLVTGNIRSTTNSKDLVFGYFSASTESQKRITITPGLGRYPTCTAPDTIPIACGPLVPECAARTGRLLLSYYGRRADSVLVTSPDCADCRLQGGTTVMPPYMK